MSCTSRGTSRAFAEHTIAINTSMLETLEEWFDVEVVVVA
jgi:hypothetical protein